MNSYTKDLKNRGMNHLAADRKQQPAWIRSATEEGVTIGYGQQLADEHSAVVELDKIEGILLAKDTLKYRLHLPNHGKDLKPSTLLTLILKMVDEVINDAH